jgi:hypothetical protein
VSIGVRIQHQPQLHPEQPSVRVSKQAFQGAIHELSEVLEPFLHSAGDRQRFRIIDIYDKWGQEEERKKKEMTMVRATRQEARVPFSFLQRSCIVQNARASLAAFRSDTAVARVSTTPFDKSTARFGQTHGRTNSARPALWTETGS